MQDSYSLKNGMKKRLFSDLRKNSPFLLLLAPGTLLLLVFAYFPMAGILIISSTFRGGLVY